MEVDKRNPQPKYSKYKDKIPFLGQRCREFLQYENFEMKEVGFIFIFW